MGGGEGGGDKEGVGGHHAPNGCTDLKVLCQKSVPLFASGGTLRVNVASANAAEVIAIIIRVAELRRMTALLAAEF